VSYPAYHLPALLGCSAGLHKEGWKQLTQRDTVGSGKAGRFRQTRQPFATLIAGNLLPLPAAHEPGSLGLGQTVLPANRR
jgi:hypothetical protein